MQRLTNVIRQLLIKRRADPLTIRGFLGRERTTGANFSPSRVKPLILRELRSIARTCRGS